jgi:putative tryptophan/tyrosine transport system substrate-binding protein
MMTRFLLRLAFACLSGMTLVLPAAAQQQTQPPVWVALADTGSAHAETAAVLQAELADVATVTLAAGRTLLDTQATPPALIITVGVAALEEILKGLATRGEAWQRVAVLATLLPRAAYEAQLAQHGLAGPARGRPISAAVLDQPLERQVALLKRALPQALRIGVLPGPQTRPQLDRLESVVRAHGRQLVRAAPVDAPEQIYPALRDVLVGSDVLLALPESLIYHPGSLQNILLTTYRARVPLVAFSAAYVKAGALLAVYSTPAQVAEMAAEMARAKLGGRSLPPVQSPRSFAVAANPKVAASLGLQLDTADVIAEDLRRGERR